MSDSGEGLVDASSRLAERMDELEEERRQARNGAKRVDPVRAGAIEGWVPPIPGDVVEVSLDTGTGEFSVSSCGRIAVVCAVACPDPLYFVVGAHDYAVRFLSRTRVARGRRRGCALHLRCA